MSRHGAHHARRSPRRAARLSGLPDEPPSLAYLSEGLHPRPTIQHFSEIGQSNNSRLPIAREDPDRRNGSEASSHPGRNYLKKESANCEREAKQPSSRSPDPIAHFWSVVTWANARSGELRRVLAGDDDGGCDHRDAGDVEHEHAASADFDDHAVEISEVYRDSPSLKISDPNVKALLGLVERVRT